MNATFDFFPQLWSALTLPTIAALLPELDPHPHGERYLSLTCPACRQREAFLYAPTGKGPHIQCNRKNRCQFDQTLFDYLKTRERGDGAAALRLLAEAAGMPLLGTRPTRQERVRQGLRHRFLVPPLPVAEVPAEAVPEDSEALNARWQAALPGSPAEAYLNSRGVFYRDTETWRYGFGYCARWPGEGRARLSYPLTDRTGRVVALAGRLLPGQEGPKCMVYGPGGGIYVPYPRPFRPEALTVVEGPLDAVALAHIGVNALAINGTAAPEWLLRACAFREVYVALDADTAGDQASERLAGHLAGKGAIARRVRPPEAGRDWGDYLQEGGMDAVLDAYLEASERGQILRVEAGSATALSLPKPVSVSPLPDEKALDAGVLLQATPSQQECARHMAQQRTRGHDHCRRKDEDLGDYGLTADYFGFLAELALYDALERNGQHPRYTLLADRAVSEPDMRLGSNTFDVKAVPPKKRFLAINQGQHQDPRRQPDYYLPVVFLADDKMQVMAPVPHKCVRTWRLMTNGHAPYFSLCVSHLQPLASLDLLLRLDGQDREGASARGGHHASTRQAEPGAD